MYEICTSDLGFAAAGTAARAEDASTLFANPAGITRLAGDQMTLGAQVLYGGVEYGSRLGVLYEPSKNARAPGGVV